MVDLSADVALPTHNFLAQGPWERPSFPEILCSQRPLRYEHWLSESCFRSTLLLDCALRLLVDERSIPPLCFSGGLNGGYLKGEHLKSDSAQGALKGTNLRGQTEPKRRFSLIFADSRLFPENKTFGKRIISQNIANFRRTPQKTADWRLSP